jgi:N-carbamoyl-L-amino-acid hydrolase
MAGTRLRSGTRARASGTLPDPPETSGALEAAPVIRVTADRLLARLAALARFGARPEGGITRPAWSEPYEAARAWLLAEMRSAGLTAWVDAAGNVFGGLGASGFDADHPVVLTGSHIDTVPDGGPLDGALGVLAGLECLQTIREAGLRLPRPLVVAAWSDEEGRYASLFGSRAFTGALDLATVPRLAAPDGERLVDAMRRAGFDPDRLAEARVAPGAVAAYVELHIEQGPRLEEAGVPIGVVEAIVGVHRTRLVFHGQADHAGTTPMDRRRDAFLGAAEFALRARALVPSQGSARSVSNVGVVSVHPGVTNIVPARAELVHEVRDPEAAVLDRLGDALAALAREVAAAHGLAVDVQRISASQPARCAPRVMAAIEESCRRLGLGRLRLHSAAGHDAQNLARIADAGMIFIPSRGGRSHRPDEASEPEAIVRGAEVLLHTLLALGR